MKAYLTIKDGSEKLGRLDLILYDESVPKTVKNFCHFLQTSSGNGYLNSSFHRIIKGFMAQGGDFLNGDGTGSTSIYGPSFQDENFYHRHDRAGVLSMANSGKDTNGSQFFITFRKTPHLDGKHVVFGHVDVSNPESQAVLKALEGVRTGPNDRPYSPLTVVDCGVIQDEKAVAPAGDDGNEIDLEEEGEEKKTGASNRTSVDPAVEDVNELELPEEEEEEEEEEPPKTKAEALKRRMRKLKLKINQARQLNKQEVLREGERMGSVEGAAKAKKRQQMQDKKLKELEWKTRNSKALDTAKAHGIDGKHLVEQADTSLKNAYLKEEKAKLNRFEINDHHNSAGQHRNYQRNLKSLHRAAGAYEITEDAAETFNPIMSAENEARERQGARNLANELKRRAEKQAKKKRERMDFEETDVTYINKRNKRFNQKISRNFDKHTAEIRQNLERGTAL